MTVSQKAALSLLISVILVAGFSVLAFTGFFNLVETHFYNPSITNSLNKEVERDADTIQNFLDELRERFSASLETDTVRRSFLPNQAAQDIFERTRVYGILMESQRGIQSVRFVDAGGLRVHFSTNAADIQTQTSETISYRNYDETTPHVPYPDLAVSSGGNPKITLDQQNERIIFSFPFYDSMEVYRGSAFFSLSIRAITERLIAEGRLKIGENLSIVSVPPGMVSGLPNAFDEAQTIIPVISAIWTEGLLSLTTLDSGSSGSALALFSAKTNQGLMVGRVVDKSLFNFPQSMKVILLSAIFLTIFLSIFLIFNLRPDTMTVVQNRLKNLQLSLIREYYERKGEMDWNHWSRELEQRREDVRSELKRGVKDVPALLEDIDSLIDKSWDEILTAIGGKRETRLAIDEDKLQNILNRMIIAAGNTPIIPGGAAAVTPFVKDALTAASVTPAVQKTDETEEEVLEELVEEVEELSAEEPDTYSTEAKEPADEPEDDIEELAEVEELEAEDLVEEPSGKEPLETAAETAALTPDESNFELVFDTPTSSEIKLSKAPEPAPSAPKTSLNKPEHSAKDRQSQGSPLDLASQIEFSHTETTDEKAELHPEFVIVSPFSSIISGFEDTTDTFKTDDVDSGKKTKTSGSLEELNTDYSMSLVYKPFQNEADPEELPAEEGSSEIIKQKNGVNYVDKKVKTPDSETAKTLDPGLKNLVDSVIGKK